ncbi:hypothetical protein HQ531_08055 [bacterium]|nr:hypothetical protein [bacterium]
MSTRKIRHLTTSIVLLAALPFMLQAQYKNEVPSIPGLNQSRASGSPSILGIDLSRVDFQNSYSMNVSSMGGDAVAIGLLKSSFNYAINPQVSVRGYVGLAHSPFSTMGPTGEQASFINGINKENVLYGGEILYRPTENMFLYIGFSREPTSPRNMFFAPRSYRNYRY